MLFLALVLKLNSVIHSHQTLLQENILQVFQLLISFFVFQDVAIMVSPSYVPNQVSKRKGCRQEEMICQDKQTLNALKERISAVEHKRPCSELH